jgi:hypothetical protein
MNIYRFKQYGKSSTLADLVNLTIHRFPVAGD